MWALVGGGTWQPPGPVICPAPSFRGTVRRPRAEPLVLGGCPQAVCRAARGLAHPGGPSTEPPVDSLVIGPADPGARRASSFLFTGSFHPSPRHTESGQEIHEKQYLPKRDEAFHSSCELLLSRAGRWTSSLRVLYSAK